MEKLQIGLLLPNSSILPASKDYERGLNEGIKAYNSELEYETIREFTGQGQLKQTDECCNRLINYHEANVITGIVSSKVIEHMADKFKQRNVPIVVSDLGGHIPRLTEINQHIFYNSMHLWSHAWALGYWGVQTLGKKGMSVSAIYDGGYSYAERLHEGMSAANPECEWSFAICPMPADGGLSDMTTLFPHIDQHEPDFILAAFCGTETTLFLNEFIRRGYHKKIKVVGLPFLMAPFAPLEDDITIYTTMPFEDASKRAEKSFFHLGYSAGTAIAKAAGSGDAFKDHLRTNEQLVSVKDDGNITAVKEVHIMQHNVTANAPSFTSVVVSTAPVQVPMDVINTKPPELEFSWLNPYLCI